ncbi:MAG: bifunctional 4-hydroxy-3-methylbut-2-enyl diphosphate reductase/30S ribosomal protein S1 [Firmicutes bacterium]|nr:bifunctional 4-hydroxy-3-methylbut-2-enyl diphosphate reductase/30S ribosomal protein S1 [Bacillota bacterium]
MELILVKNCGFCFGVRRAVELAEQTAAEYGHVDTLGPLIHNDQELRALAPRITAVDAPEDCSGKVLLIRSHGVGPAAQDHARELGLTLVDATCPFVRKAQRLACMWANLGYQVVVVGDRDHPEVQGICGWTGDRALVVSGPEEAAALGHYPRLAVLAQTTEKKDNFTACISVLQDKTDDLQIKNTICDHTERVRSATAALAARVDAMIVVGGRHSSNTLKLAQVSRSAGIPVFHVETAGELDMDIVRGFGRIGLTAGASTPQHIIEEVVKSMSELENVEVEVKETVETAQEAAPEVEETPAAAAAEETPAVAEEPEQSEEDAFTQEYGDMKEIRRGARVKGVVVQVKDDELLVDIGGKSEGVLSSSELSKEDAENIRERFHVGDEIDVLILRRENQEGYPVLSKRRVDQDIAWDRLAQLKADKEIVTGTVTDVVKGGVLVDVGLRGFVPASLVALGYVEDLSTYVGKELQMKIIECDKHSNKLVLSAKAVLRNASKQLKEKTWAEIAEGQTRHGVVRRLTNFGAFVDIGGVDGLLHVSEMAWYRVNHPSDLLKEGDELDVYILGIDQENEKISLGLKQLIPNPWTLAQDKYPVGSIISAKVMRTTTFGAFLEVEPGVEGLVHISQMANHRVEKTEDVVKPGDVVNVKVLAVDPEAKRMSLSIKATLPEGEDFPLPEAAPAAPAEEEAPAEE